MWVFGLSNRKCSKTPLIHNECRYSIIRSANQAENLSSKWKTIKLDPAIHAEKLILGRASMVRIVIWEQGKPLVQSDSVTVPSMLQEERLRPKDWSYILPLKQENNMLIKFVSFGISLMSELKEGMEGKRSLHFVEIDLITLFSTLMYVDG